MRTGTAGRYSSSASATRGFRASAGSRAMARGSARRIRALSLRRWKWSALGSPPASLSSGRFEAQALLPGVDTIAASPGIALRDPLLVEAKRRGIEIVGDVEIFARALRLLGNARPRMIGITGTNGKSTVTAMAGGMCRAAGLRTVVAGNIGLPVLDALRAAEDAGQPDVNVVELSSYQLETTSSLDLDCATVLNVTQDHLDRYDGIADYARAKERIFGNATTRLVNRDDEWSRAMGRENRHDQLRRRPAERRARLRHRCRARLPRAGKRRADRDGRGRRAGPPQRIERAGRQRAGPRGRRARARRFRRPAPLPGPAAPHRARRGGERRALLRRFEGHQCRRDGRRAGRLRAAGGADRRRRRQGAGLRAAQARSCSSMPAPWC